MRTWIASACQFVQSEDGPTAVEYAMMLALILVGCVLIVTNVGATVSGSFSKVQAGFGS